MRFKSTPQLKNKEDYVVTPIWTEKSITKLINYGIYIGHSYKNTNHYNSWMVLGVRQGIHLLNLLKFQYMFRSALFAIDKIVRRGAPIWFVNLDKIVEKYTKKYATICGEYGITENWNHGLLTNFRMTKRRKSFKHPIVWRKKDKLLESNFRNWGLTRRTWPRMLFVSNVKSSYRACIEADHLQLPIIGIVDSDAPTLFVDIAIPGNDEGVYPTIYYNSMVAMFILYKKFNFVYQWYLSARNKIKTKKADLFKSPVSIAFKAAQLYPMRQLWQDARRDEVIKKRKAKNHSIDTSTRFFSFYRKIIKHKKAKRYNKKRFLPSLFKKYYYFSKRFFKWRRYWNPKRGLRIRKSTRYFNQLKRLYLSRGIAYKKYIIGIWNLRKRSSTFRRLFRTIRIPIYKNRRKHFKKWFYLTLFRRLRYIKRAMRRFVRTARSKAKLRKAYRYSTKLQRGLVRSRRDWRKLLRMLRYRRGKRLKIKALIKGIWGKVLLRAITIHKSLHYWLPQVKSLNKLARKLFFFNKRIRRLHKSRYFRGSRIDFLRTRTNAYDISRPRILRKRRKIKRKWWMKIRRFNKKKRRRRFNRRSKFQKRGYFKLRKILHKIENATVRRWLMGRWNRLTKVCQLAMITSRPFKLVRRSKSSRNLFSWWLSFWAKSKAKISPQPVRLPRRLRFARKALSSKIMLKLSKFFYDQQKKRDAVRRRRYQIKPWWKRPYIKKYWKHIKKNYRRT